MVIIVSSMHRDAIKSLKNQNYALANDVIERDDGVDRSYSFLLGS